MKKVMVSFILVLFSCTWAAAESSVWKAQKGNSILYLGGTCHILRESDFPLPKEFDKAYRASDSVVFETDIGSLQDPESQQKLLALSMYTDGSTVDQHLSSTAYGELKGYCKSNGIPLSSLSVFKPSMLMTMLTFMELTKMGVTQRGVDMFFYEMATRDKKGIEELETVDEQINYVATMADGSENEYVSYSIRDMEAIKQQFEVLVHAWRIGDTKKLDQMMNADLKSRLPNLYRRLMTDRNRNWLPKIDAFQKTPQTEFILVGVGHLVGPNGIIESLRKKGYMVEKL